MPKSNKKNKRNISKRKKSRNIKKCNKIPHSQNIYDGFINILKKSKNKYEIWKLNKHDPIFEDHKFIRYIIQLINKENNKTITIEDIYMRMYYYKIIKFMKAHSIDGVTDVWLDLCRHSVGDIPRWLSINIFSYNPGGFILVPDTLFTHEYIFFIEKCSKELRGILVFKIIKDLDYLGNFYDEIQIKLLCTSVYTTGLGSRIIKSLKSFYQENTGNIEKNVFARIIEPTKKAVPFYEKMKFKKQMDGTMVKQII